MMVKLTVKKMSGNKKGVYLFDDFSTIPLLFNMAAIGIDAEMEYKIKNGSFQTYETDNFKLEFVKTAKGFDKIATNKDNAVLWKKL